MNPCATLHKITCIETRTTALQQEMNARVLHQNVNHSPPPLQTNTWRGVLHTRLACRHKPIGSASLFMHEAIAHGATLPLSFSKLHAWRQATQLVYQHFFQLARALHLTSSQASSQPGRCAYTTLAQLPIQSVTISSLIAPSALQLLTACRPAAGGCAPPPGHMSGTCAGAAPASPPDTQGS